MAPTQQNAQTLAGGRALTPKEAAFVNQFPVDWNGTQAAIRAGYSARSARHTAWELLRKPHIQAALKAAMDHRARMTGIDAARVLKELGHVGFSDPRELVDDNGVFLGLKKLPGHVAAAIASIEFVNRSIGDKASEQVLKVKFWSKPAALELLARHTGLVAAGGADEPLPAAATSRPLRVVFGGRYAPTSRALPVGQVSGAA